MLRILLIALVSLILPTTAATAQDSPRAILVLDGSGSMWGQIDGVNKIVIAREVIGELLGTLPADQELGLMSYGHRRKGDCSDIELLIEPGTDRAAIAAAVNAINPKGKTPLSDAVIQAAEALRFSEEVATVILVSDGIETCERDPCAVGRMLEETGVNFTAHVIGFDVADPAALAQLQCLAEETGGQFRTAANAAELAEALAVVAEPEPAAPVAVTFQATDGDGGPVIASGLIWNIGTQSDGALIKNGQDASPSLDLLPGSGLAEVLRIADEAVGEAMFTVTGDETGGKVVTIALPEMVPDATLDAPASAPAGSLVPVRWSGPDGEGDYLSSSNLDMHDGEYYHYGYTRDTEDGVVMVRMPPEDGIFEIRYVLNSSPPKVLARRQIEVTPLDITLTPPDGAVIGTEARAGWTGPDYEGDYLTIARPEDEAGKYETYAYTSAGDPAPIVMPAMPGTYELRYVLGASRHVAARALFDVVETSISVTAPETAPEGATIKISWEGPDGKNDYISIAAVDAPDNKYDAYTYTREGSPLKLTLPMGAGGYEIRYVLGQDRTVLARVPITLTPVTATLDAVETIAAGSTISVTWDGPDYDRDYVAVADPDAAANRYLAYAYTGNGNPARFAAPLEPGEYELRYIANSSPDVVLARRAIRVTEVGATLDAPATAPAGSTLAIGWDGPDNARDYVAIAEPDADANRYVAYAYTASGNPAKVQMPTAPGDYELRYVANGSPDKVLVRQAIRIEAVDATLSAPTSIAAGAIITVDWTGPGGERDYITIADPDAAPNRHMSFEYTRSGNPAKLKVPTTPGRYEVRYVLNGSPDTVIATATLEVTEVTATLVAPDSAPAGSNLRIDWTGPGGDRDYITIADPDAAPNRHVSFEYARSGNPAQLKVPTTPGRYEVRYVQDGSPDTVLATATLEVTEVTASLDAPGSAPAGSKLRVDWTGPGGDRDYITIADPDAAPNRHVSFEYARSGNPAVLDVPTTPGRYVLRYVQDGSPDTVIAMATLEVTPVSATLDVPASIPVGSTFEVTWDGPGGDRDFISVAGPDEDVNRYATYEYVRGGNPLKLSAPAEPGAYELRYVQHGTPQRIIGTTMIDVIVVTASLDAPASAAAGSSVEVTWDGPGYPRDYLSIAQPDEKPSRYTDYAYASDGSPAVLQMPAVPGTYELRYVMMGTPATIIARRTIIVE
ncbi:VWA domain-containing protein [Maritimibacter fusiformis]|nr:VWA domain-containing protein [Maritimibacter fusiformis]